MGTLLLGVLVAVLVARETQAARILGIVPTPSISHQLPFRMIVLELARRGHQVTFITTDPIKRNVGNYTEIDLSASYKVLRDNFDMTSMSANSVTDIISVMPHMSRALCEMQLDLQPMKVFLQSRPTFDAIILERLSNLCYYGLIHHLGSPPTIGFLSLTAPVTALVAYGNPINPSYLPDFFVGYTDHMTFWQRLHNAYVMAYLLYTWNYRLMPTQGEVITKYFGPEVPPVHEMEKNFSLLLVNNHFSVNFPRPFAPNLVELTSLHIEKERRPLPKDVQEFLDGAEHGVIYFSLGSNVKSADLPEHKKVALLAAFRQLPQRVLWKFEAEDLPGRPTNVMISKWLPQQDVLAYPKVKLFITQGGLQSFNEASYFGVPLIGIPFIADQHQNAVKIVQSGIGYRLLLEDVTTESVLKAIHTVLENKSYAENMQRFSAVYREHEQTSLARAVWWIEYVIRHNGARHLRPASLDLYWWQLLLLDVGAFVLVAASVIMYLVYRSVKFLIKLVHGTLKQKVQ